jgi:two-component system, OmpR family, sensor histidine kinase KdpD
VNDRPSPDELLRLVAAERAREERGKLTVFFGAAPGVGKTYAMLEAARHELEQEKRDVAVGIVETHGRYDTGAQLLGLELLPRRKLKYRGVEVEELDLDAALSRRPQLLLVDELAHTNAEGSRHPKRWQDVEELLDAGIDVFSTMNVQHVESLNDVVAKVTGVRVRETVPDSVLEDAHEIKLVDLPPDALLERLRDGKVYVPAQAARALESFFKKGNLIALRELSLRHTAERVDAQMREYRRAQGIEQTWPVVEQLLVAVSPSPYSARLIRAARRMASSLHARWVAVYVEQPSARKLHPAVETQLSRNLRLAEQLGAEVVTLSGDDAADELLSFARERNITRLIVGKPVVGAWHERFRSSLVDRLVRMGGDIDVYVTAGDHGDEPEAPRGARRERLRPSSIAAAVAVSALSTAVALLAFGRDQLPDVVMTFLLGIMLVSSRFELRASILAAFLSVAAFDFFFVPPYLTFAVADLRHATTFVVMFLVAIVISGLTQRVRNQAVAARERERRTAALYELSRELTAARDEDSVLRAGVKHLERAFSSSAAVFKPQASGELHVIYPAGGDSAASEHDRSIGQWVWDNQREAGLGTSTLPSATALYVPLRASGGVVGVLGLTPRAPHGFDQVEQRRQIDAFATQLALGLERALLAEETTRARREMEAEQLRSALLSSVSHDLRTPLAVITGATSTLLQGDHSLEHETRTELLTTVLEEAERLNRLIGNLLDMTRLESGAVKVKKEWLPLEELVGAALDRLDRRLAGREVHVELAAELPLVPCDAVLIEQTLINLLENAAKYSAGPIDLGATATAGEVVVSVEDRGPGVPAGDETRIFEKFQRAAHEGSPDGVGLGLTICRAIVAAHGGRIWVEGREGGGAAFRFTLPIDGTAPPLPAAEPLEVHAESRGDEQRA